MSLTSLLLGANLIALAALAAWLLRLQRHTAALRASAQALAADAAVLPPAADAISAARPFYTIEILNPLEVASQESWLGEVFGGLTPGLVRREVYRRAHAIIRQQLADRGIRADVRLHG